MSNDALLVDDVGHASGDDAKVLGTPNAPQRSVGSLISGNDNLCFCAKGAMDLISIGADAPPLQFPRLNELLVGISKGTSSCVQTGVPSLW